MLLTTQRSAFVTPAPVAMVRGGGVHLQTQAQSAFSGSLIGPVFGYCCGMLLRGPTHHSTGPARKAAQAGEFKR